MSDRRTVTFHNESFNTRTPRPYFINAGCFGDDVLDWLGVALGASGARVVGKPEQEDFGWYLRFEHGRVEYSFVIGYRPAAPDEAAGGRWIGTLERSRGLLGSIVGLRRVGVGRDALLLLHQQLSRMPDVSGILWHDETEFHRGIEDRAAATPS
ncbi:MAG TPA: hypothetical protein VGG91_07105 [Myxococcaceae bacterium]